ncbi:hypothetical protein ACN3XK_13465 [Actinomadura welshii]
MTGRDLDRRRLEELVPSPARSESPDALARRLADVPADALVDLVLDNGEPWWRRAACALGLTGRVPDDRAPELLDLVRDAGATGEIRAAVLKVLAVPGRPHSEALLTWLRAQEHAGDKAGHRLETATMPARARLADLTAAERLTVLAADPWRHRREAGRQGIDELIERNGLPAVLAALGADSPQRLAARGTTDAARLLGLRLVHRAGGDVTPSLADPSTRVAREAHDLLAATSDPAATNGPAVTNDEALLAIVRERRAGHLWALSVLHRRGHAIRTMWEALGSPRVRLPDVPSDIREAIVRRYTPGQHDTDPLWLVEAACLDPAVDADGVEDRLGRATRALAAADLDPRPPVPAGEHHGSGRGTYHVIDTDAGPVRVSTLGPYFMVGVSVLGADAAHAGAAMRTAGFRHIDDDLAAVRFERLHVYFFGDRAPLTVGDLLFYWQD